MIVRTNSNSVTTQSLSNSNFSVLYARYRARHKPTTMPAKTKFGHRRRFLRKTGGSRKYGVPRLFQSKSAPARGQYGSYQRRPWNLWKPQNLDGANPFPSRYWCTMTFCHILALAGGTAGVVGSEFDLRLNSVYQPLMGVSHQPYNSDILEQIYNAYKVHWVIVEGTCRAQSLEGVQLILSVDKVGDSFPINGVSTQFVIEQGRSEFFQLGTTGNNDMVMFKKFFRMAPLFNISDESFRADITQSVGRFAFSDPPSVPLLRIALGNDSGTNGGGATLTLKVTYRVECFQLKTKTYST